MPFPVLAAASLALGAYQAFKGAQGLKKLSKEKVPEYSISPELQSAYGLAQERSKFGYDPAQTAAFKQNVAQQQNTGFRQGVSMSGGNLAQALRTGLQSQRIGSFNQFASDDAALKAQHVSQLYGLSREMQGQQNVIQSNRIQRRTMMEQAYGGAVRSGLNNIANSLNLTQAMGGGLKGMGFVGGGAKYTGGDPYAGAEFPTNDQVLNAPDMNSYSNAEQIPETNWKGFMNASKNPQ